MTPRPGVPRTITDAQVEEVVVRTLEEVPEGATHWSKRELAGRAGISPSSVLRIWRAFGLQPWRTETFKVSPDLLLIDKIRDVAGLYRPRRRTRLSSAWTRNRRSRLIRDVSGVRVGRQQPALPVSPSVADGLSGGPPVKGTADYRAGPGATPRRCAFCSSCHRRVRKSATCGNAVL